MEQILQKPVTHTEAELIVAVKEGDLASFEPLIRKYQQRLLIMARRYARRESEVEDIVQEIFIKAYQKLKSFRGEAPFEHWLMRLAVRTCYDFLRAHQRNRETPCADLTEEQNEWLDHFQYHSREMEESSAVACELVQEVLKHLSPSARLIITLLEIEERSVKEIAQLTGWSIPLVKVRAFRARQEMRKCLLKLMQQRKL